MPSHTKQPKDFDSLVDEVERARAEVQRAVDQKRAEIVAHALRIGSRLLGSSSKPAPTESAESAPESAVVRDVPPAEEPKADPLQQTEPQESKATEQPTKSREGRPQLAPESRRAAVMHKVEHPDKYHVITTAEAAILFDCNKRTIQNWVRNGYLTAGPKRGTITMRSIIACSR